MTTRTPQTSFTVQPLLTWEFLVTAGAFIALVTLLVIFSSFGFPWVYAGSFSDGVSYLYAADALAEISTPVNLQAITESPVAPGYPAVLALFGASSTAPIKAVLAQVVIVASATILLVLYFARLTKSPAAALLLATISLLMPWNLPWAFELTPEALVVALLSLLFFLARSDIKPTALVWLLSVVVAFLCLVRTECAPAIVALAVWATGRNLSWRLIFAATALAAAPMLGWFFIGASENLVCSGDCPILGLFTPNQHEFWNFVESEVAGLGSAMSLSMPASRRSIAAGIIVFALALATVYRETRQRQIDGLFLALFLPTTAFYDDPGHRVLFVGTTLPFMIGMACLTLTTAMQRWRSWPTISSPATIAAIAVAAGSIMMTPVWQQSLSRIISGPKDARLAPYTRSFAWFASRRPDTHLQLEHDLIEIAQTARTYVPDNECIYGTIPWMMSLHTQRRVIELPIPVVSDAGQFIASECRWFLVSTFGGPHDRYLPLYPLGVDAGELQPILVPDHDAAAALLIRR